jgi:hypothetical protein
MPIDPKKLEGYKEFDQKFLKIIDEFGWHVMSVAPRTDQEVDLWSYSTGLFYHSVAGHGSARMKKEILLPLCRRARAPVTIGFVSWQRASAVPISPAARYQHHMCS